MKKQHQFNITYIIFTIIAVFVIQMFIQSAMISVISYSDFRSYLANGQIASVTVTEQKIEGTFKQPQNGKSLFITERIDTDLLAELDAAGVEYFGASEANWLTAILSWVLPVVFFLGIWFFVIRPIAGRQGMGGMMSIGQSKAKVYVESETGITFDDVAGVDQAKMELEEVVSFLKDKDKYERLGAHIPKGILLVGPPGTGKTLLARAVAGQAGVVFFSISGSEFVEMFVGVGAARVRDLFQQARKAAPCIIFIDELDALGRARLPMGGMGGSDEKEQTLNQLLAELDGFDPSVGIVLLAATNRPEILDPALLRAGRFDRQIVVDRPDRNGRIAILKVHLRKITVDPDVDTDQIAGLIPGFTGADIANLVNEAAIMATRRHADAVSIVDFTKAIERIVAGSERPGRLLNPHERKRVAYHEMGHALAAANTPSADPVHKVSIIPRSIGALGYTLQRPTEDRFVITKSELTDRMTVLLAGRAAEDIVFGEVSTGAADDLVKVTDIARQIVMRFGMMENLGQTVLEENRSTYLGDSGAMSKNRDFSEATAREVDLAVRGLVDEAYSNAKKLLEAHRENLGKGAVLLLEKETVTPAEFPPLTQPAENANTV
jgi:cell division protease FtsH